MLLTKGITEAEDFCDPTAIADVLNDICAFMKDVPRQRFRSKLGLTA